MKVWYSPYTLNPLFALNAKSKDPSPRQGFLLKVEFSDAGLGYADCHPWPEFGDDPAYIQLEGLQKDRPSPLLARSLELARWDAGARSKGESLFPTEPVLSSHYTLPDWENFSLPLLNDISNQGYAVIKLKVGPNLEEAGHFLRRLISVLPEDMKLRLDFNLTGDPESLSQWISGLGQDFLPCIDFFEDPFPYDPDQWKAFRDKWGIPMALDQELRWDQDLSGADVLVIKPVRNSGEDIEKCADLFGQKRWVFTHAMDHPVGRMMALAYAMNFYGINPQKVEAGGFESRPIYHPTAFDDGIFTDGYLQLGTDDVGIGFSQQLDDCEWTECL
ncbi:MAG: hypothetical protein H6624_11370 [Bdellovibrionaceae bacterium]|nr:hypothetical protein [Bdellovibrionales bacterium]MCB9084938.1 hypothetical protein [Pseudobdellovibrionaceae bacterium]